MSERLETFKVPPHTGRVCYLTEGETKWTVTVECPELCRAFCFEVQPRSKLRIGDYVKFYGIVRMIPGVGLNGRPYEKNLEYTHDPHDGSHRLHWIFFLLKAQGWQGVAPPDVAETLGEVLHSTGLILELWNGVPTSQLHGAILTLEKAVEFLRPVLKQRLIDDREMAAPIKALDLEI